MTDSSVSVTSEVAAVLAADRVMAILRYREGGDVLAAVDGLASGGIRVLEITADTPDVWRCVEQCAGRDGLIIGVGTVTRVEQVRRVVEMGGRFIVSPGVDAEVVVAAQEAGLAVLPGVATGTEILLAARAGVRLFKLFPAGALGVGYLQALRGPFGDAAFVPTGGIAIDEVADWVEAGALAVALGSDLAGRQPPSSRDGVEALRVRAEAALRQARGVGR